MTRMQSRLPDPSPVLAGELIEYWQKAGARGDWFAQRPGFDRAFRDSYLTLHEAARDGHLAAWEDSPQGALALLILLDQFPRNAFRGTPRMYATDAQARRIARQAMARDHIARVPAALQLFMLLPFAHSEALADQDISVALHRRFLPSGLGRARRHRDIIARHGRFPHRNAILDRPSRRAEDHYLENGGFRG